MPSDVAITPLLRDLAAQFPAYDARSLWNEAVDAASSLPRHRGADGEDLADALATLRLAMKGEVVAFHKYLDIKPAEGAAAGSRRWLVRVPLTLFPRRDHGFTRVECALQFAAPRDGGRFRVIDAMPVDRSETLAEAAMGAELQVEASAKAGAPIAIPVGSTVASASAKVYGSGKANFKYTVQRAAVVSEVVGGTGALWRLENPSRPDELAAEGHQLAVVIEADERCSLDAAGYVKAYSEVQWLSSSVTNFLKNLGDTVRRYFAEGAPVEAYGEWRDILAGDFSASPPGPAGA